MKILFLSIGTGNLFEKVTVNEKEDKHDLLMKMVSENKYAYKTSRYRLNGKEYESPFIAEALIDQFNPDMILLVGTVKSAWSSFYACFSNDYNKYEKLMKLKIMITNRLRQKYNGFIRSC